MSGFYTVTDFAPVPNSFVEVAPATIVGLIDYTFPSGPQDPIFIRPGNVTQQNYPWQEGSEWLLYTRSVMSFSINVINENGSAGGACLIVMIGDWEAAASPVLNDWMPFHLMSGGWVRSDASGIELPGLLVRFKIRTCNDVADTTMNVKGSIVVRGI